jgi:hypothetical protein
MGIFQRFLGVVKKDWHRESPRMLFNILNMFLLTFTVAHLYSLFVPYYVFIAGYHIHHFYYGMAILAITSIVGVVTNHDGVRHFLSYMVGIGIGLIVDELGLLLNCTGEKVGLACQYLFPNTFDIVLIISLIMLIFIFFGNKPIRWFLPKSWRNIKEIEHMEHDIDMMKAHMRKDVKKLLK